MAGNDDDYIDGNLFTKRTLAQRRILRTSSERADRIASEKEDLEFDGAQSSIDRISALIAGKNDDDNAGGLLTKRAYVQQRMRTSRQRADRIALETEDMEYDVGAQSSIDRISALIAGKEDDDNAGGLLTKRTLAQRQMRTSRRRADRIASEEEDMESYVGAQSSIDRISALIAGKDDDDNAGGLLTKRTLAQQRMRTSRQRADRIAPEKEDLEFDVGAQSSIDRISALIAGKDDDDNTAGLLTKRAYVQQRMRTSRERADRIASEKEDLEFDGFNGAQSSIDRISALIAGKDDDDNAGNLLTKRAYAQQRMRTSRQRADRIALETEDLEFDVGAQSSIDRISALIAGKDDDDNAGGLLTKRAYAQQQMRTSRQRADRIASEKEDMESYVGAQSSIDRISALIAGKDDDDNAGGLLTKRAYAQQRMRTSRQRADRITSEKEDISASIDDGNPSSIDRFTSLIAEDDNDVILSSKKSHKSKKLSMMIEREKADDECKIPARLMKPRSITGICAKFLECKMLSRKIRNSLLDMSSTIDQKSRLTEYALTCALLQCDIQSLEVIVREIKHDKIQLVCKDKFRLACKLVEEIQTKAFMLKLQESLGRKNRDDVKRNLRNLRSMGVPLHLAARFVKFVQRALDFVSMSRKHDGKQDRKYDGKQDRKHEESMAISEEYATFKDKNSHSASDTNNNTTKKSFGTPTATPKKSSKDPDRAIKVNANAEKEYIVQKAISKTCCIATLVVCLRSLRAP